MDIHVRFDVICGSSTDQDRTISQAKMAAVPAPGEVVSVLGNPYVVVERGWAATNGCHCFIRISNLYVHAEAVLDPSQYKVIRKGKPAA